ncbi:winged helix-turn-helix transcriptional regulator [Paenibacillus spongiae]|uniref:Winged helix-turn-helix domain-containing protein n=1 Tax=Paenibacillus spongiae TaxID=2909671 RepID=A0ABY5SJ75_9BACL|nr:winged helix-turn-helix domain-containing protein [Paenibacillus spongiae]UVI32725.1 winged helix-turn-helix domain-containing protein [Paenibacillus spongiae]
MQREENSGAMNGGLHLSPPALPHEFETFDEGAFCDSTLRIVVVSPLPASLRALVSALTTRCYDVLVFHNENDPILATIQADLIIIDRRKNVVTDNKPVRGIGSESALLLLMNERPSAPVEGEVLVWPSPVASAMVQIEELASKSQANAALKPSEVSSEDQLLMKDIRMDLKRMTVQRGGRPVSLTKTEFDLLRILSASGGSVMSRQEIMEQIWGDGYFGGSNSVDVHIKSLRQKLGDDPKNPQYILTVRGVGYRFADS